MITTKRVLGISGFSLLLFVLGYGAGTWRSGQGNLGLLSDQLANVGAISGVPQELNDGVGNIALQLMHNREAPLRAVVVEFTDSQGFGNDFTRFVGDRLSTLLAKDPTASLETEEHVSPLLKEFGLTSSDLFDVAKSGQARRRLNNVRQLLTGTISDLGTEVGIDAEVINWESGKIEATAAVSVTKTEAIAAMLTKGRRLVRGEIPSPYTLTEPLTRKLDFRFPQTVNRKDLDFILDSCQLEDIFVTCRVRAFNNGKIFRNLFVTLSGSYLVDMAGRQYSLQSVQAVGDIPSNTGKFYQRGGWDFPPAVRRALDLSFSTKDLPQNIQIASIVVEFGSYPNGRGFPDRPIVIFTR